ncbi:hypothetical protein, partial [Staphylococcus aureus]|uniref:hypothetical protein n=1 Tax=Staphylococcus aureus TaxID=1280 RepID=UPI0039BE0EDA
MDKLSNLKTLLQESDIEKDKQEVPTSLNTFWSVFSTAEAHPSTSECRSSTDLMKHDLITAPS